MKGWQIFILIFSGLGIFNSLAFTIYMGFPDVRQKRKNLFLQIILLAFILQIIHALIELFNWRISPYYANLYLLGSYVQGPAVYLYLQKSIKPDYEIWPKGFLVHFLPYIIIASLKYNFDKNGLLEWIAIYLVGIQYLFYILIGIKPYMTIRKQYKQGNKQLYLIYFLFPVFAFLWLNYPFSGITGINYQLWETILHSCFVYYLIFLMIKTPKPENNKYRFSTINPKESLNIYHNLINEIKVKEYYLDTEITLRKLSKKVNISINIISQVTNQNSGLNFPDFINTFRIEKAMELLPVNIRKGFTISSVAFDCGFNSLSAFNRAFKKTTGKTPSEYLKSL